MADREDHRLPEDRGRVNHPHAPDPYVLREQADELHAAYSDGDTFGVVTPKHPDPPVSGETTGQAGGVTSSAPSAVPFEAVLAWLHGLADVLPVALAARVRYVALDLAREARLQS